MGSNPDATPLDYANPANTPPFRTDVDVRDYDDETIVIIPPVSIVGVSVRLVAEALLGTLVVVTLLNELSEARTHFLLKFAMGIAIAFTVMALCASCWWRLRQTRRMTVIRATETPITVYSPRFIMLARTWPAAEIDQVNVSLGGALRIGRGWSRCTVLDAARSKRELRWIAGILNHRMKKK